MHRFYSVDANLSPRDAHLALLSLPASAVLPWASDNAADLRAVLPLAPAERCSVPAPRQVDWMEEDPERWDGLS